jgi:hypothetical protein
LARVFATFFSISGFSEVLRLFKAFISGENSCQTRLFAVQFEFFEPRIEFYALRSAVEAAQFTRAL